MTLRRWVEYGWLKPHRSSREEVRDLLAIADRDLENARIEKLSPDWRFGIAYNVALKLCTVLLHGSGFRAGRDLAHKRTIEALPLILGETRATDAVYLDACRKKRHIVEYETAGSATDADADELIGFAEELREDAVEWLRANHPELV